MECTSTHNNKQSLTTSVPLEFTCINEKEKVIVKGRGSFKKPWARKLKLTEKKERKVWYFDTKNFELAKQDVWIRKQEGQPFHWKQVTSSSRDHLVYNSTSCHYDELSNRLNSLGKKMDDLRCIEMKLTTYPTEGDEFLYRLYEFPNGELHCYCTISQEVNNVTQSYHQQRIQNTLSDLIPVRSAIVEYLCRFHPDTFKEIFHTDDTEYSQQTFLLPLTKKNRSQKQNSGQILLKKLRERFGEKDEAQ